MHTCTRAHTHARAGVSVQPLVHGVHPPTPSPVPPCLPAPFWGAHSSKARSACSRVGIRGPRCPSHPALFHCPVGFIEDVLGVGTTSGLEACALGGLSVPEQDGKGGGRGRERVLEKEEEAGWGCPCAQVQARFLSWHLSSGKGPGRAWVIYAQVRTLRYPVFVLSY